MSLIKAPVYIGSDPEIFLVKDGAVIGSEKVIPEDGLRIENGSHYFGPEVVLDGVQVELNPRAGASSQYLAKEISNAFKALKAHLEKTPEVAVCFNTVVDVTQAELDSLSEKSRRFNCKPSRNFYGLKSSLMDKGFDSTKYLKRHASGHFHLGLSAPIYNQKVDERDRVVPPLDLLAGNTGTIIDRDPGAVERRVYYGLPGEYRLPKHGLEYRTLSNFWLRAHPLYDLMSGLCVMAVSLVHTTMSTNEDIEMDIMAKVDLEKVILAIRANDPSLAWENFEHVKKFVTDHVPVEKFVVGPDNLTQTEKALKLFETEGVEKFFPQDPLAAWTGDGAKLTWRNWLLENMKD